MRRKRLRNSLLRPCARRPEALSRVEVDTELSAAAIRAYWGSKSRRCRGTWEDKGGGGVNKKKKKARTEGSKEARKE